MNFRIILNLNNINFIIIMTFFKKFEKNKHKEIFKLFKMRFP